MSKECPLDYIKSIQCSGPVEISKGHWICRRNDSICQNRLNGRTFERQTQPLFEAPPNQTFNFSYREP